jgi:hypothetical protein
MAKNQSSKFVSDAPYPIRSAELTTKPSPQQDCIVTMKTGSKQEGRDGRVESLRAVTFYM